MDGIVLAHGGTVGAVAELGLIAVPLVIMGVLSLVRRRKGQVPEGKKGPSARRDIESTITKPPE